MADENATIRAHMTAARDHMAGPVARRKAVEDQVAAERAARAQQAAQPPTPSPREAA